MKKRIALVLTVMLAIALIPWTAFANQFQEEQADLEVLMTQEEYNDLKSKDKLPDDIPIKIVKDKESKMPEGLIPVEDALHKTEFGKKILKEYGEDLTKETILDGNRKMIEKIEYKHYKYPKNYKEKVSLSEKISNFISPSACAAGCSLSDYVNTTKTTLYTLGSVTEAKQQLTVILDGYSNGTPETFWKHKEKMKGQWWRGDNLYTFTEVFFNADALGNLCAGGTINETTYESTEFTVGWSDYNNSLTYTWGDQTLNWSPFLPTNIVGSSKDSVYGKINHRGTYLKTLSTVYTIQ
jgi:hypothetical protein